MMTAVVPNSRMIDVSMFNIGERVITMSEAEHEKELERERHNAAYLEKLDQGYKDAMNGNFIPMTLTELRALLND